MCIADSVRDASTKLRGTFLSLVNSGLHPHGLNPLTFLSIYKYVVLPKALYGCELWSSLSLANITQLERSQRFCLKFIQKVTVFTNNDIVLAACGVSPIETEIDYKKLQFFGQLCRLPNRYVSKQIFVN